MLSGIHQFLFYFHLAFGSVGLFVFWLPMLSKKGSAFHKTSGKIFTYAMFVVSISGIIMSLLVLVEPIGVRAQLMEMDAEATLRFVERSRSTALFLLMLSILVFVSVKHSVLVLKAKNNRLTLRKYSHVIPVFILMLTGLIVGYLGISSGKILLIVFSVISMLASWNLFHYIFKKQIKKREWILSHVGNIMGAGIGAYTAFFAFGGSHFFHEIFAGQLFVIPWLLPSVIGVPAIIYLTRKYRQQYKVI